MKADNFFLFAGLVLAAALFSISLFYSVKDDIKYCKFMALGLLNIAALGSVLFIFYYPNDFKLILAVVVFFVFSILCYTAYQLNRK